MNFIALRLYLTSFLVVATATVSTGCNKGSDSNTSEKATKNAESEPPSKGEEKDAGTNDNKKTSPQPAPKPKPVEKVFRKKLDIDELTPKKFTGHLVRVYRRAMTTAIITVHQVRTADEDDAMDQESQLIKRGWKPWPPGPAPQKAHILASTDPSMKECPFILNLALIPSNGVERLEYKNKCFQTVELMNKALLKQERINYLMEVAKPCKELIGKPIADDDHRRRELRHKCRYYGIKLDNHGKLR